MSPPVYDEREQPLRDLGALAESLRETGSYLTGRADELRRIGRELDPDPQAVAEKAAAVGIHVAGLTLQLAELAEIMGEHHRRDQVQRAKLWEAVHDLQQRVEG